MKQGRVSIFLLISVVFWSAIAQAQVLGSDGTRQPASSGASGMTGAPRSSWEAWLNHGARDFTPESQGPPRSPDLGKAPASRSPSIGPGSGLIGSEAGRIPSQLRLTGEPERSETGSDRSGR
ncbi:MAG: conserved exported protein of unknown function [Nitrospira sp.]|nr:MAG: conserved exported protein of unknown function [Nitrospira sp.]